jgi:hypothetical protein
MRTRRTFRAGWTLLELMVVIPLMALLLSASAVLMTSVLRSQGALWSQIQQESARSRLALQFREDAHAAGSATVSSPKVCELWMSEVDFVRYEIKENSLHREVRVKEEIVERADFPLEGLSASFVLEESGERPLVRLTMESSAEQRQHSRPCRPATIEAAIGLHQPPAVRSQP